MYTIKENLRPIIQQYNDWLNGCYLSGLLQFKGQKEAGGDYISKVFKAKAHQIQSRWKDAVSAVQNPTYFGFLKDNLCRLLLLNGADRLVTAYQALPSVSRYNRPSTFSFLATEIMNDGAFRGTLRGLSLNFLQASLILWPSVYITNKSNGGGLVEFLATYSILDTILYPLDGIKNRMYANTIVPLTLRQALSETGLHNAWRGLLSKLAFNIPFVSALYTTATGSDFAPYLWLATAIAYPLNTLKVNQQLSNTKINHFRSYRGVLPFLLINYFCAWQLTALFSQEKLEDLRQEVMDQSDEKLGYH